jgi:peptide/nickel transport system permease protein
MMVSRQEATPWEPELAGAPRSPLALTLARLRRSRSAMAGLTLLALLVAVAALAPLLAPYDPLAMQGTQALLPPSPAHPFGTDQFGRDVFSRILHGARLSLPAGVLPVVFALVFGVSLGLVAGYEGGWLRAAIMRLTDVLLAFPVLLLALFIVAMLGPDFGHVTVGVGISFIPNYVRITYGSVLSVREREYILAARAYGCGPARIVLRHILPNILSPVIVLAALNVAWAILTVASLSFLGLGVQPPTPEWGMMVKEGSGYLRNYWWVSTCPGFAIMLTVWSANLLGDGLRDALDYRLML